MKDGLFYVELYSSEDINGWWFEIMHLSDIMGISFYHSCKQFKFVDLWNKSSAFESAQPVSEVHLYIIDEKCLCIFIMKMIIQVVIVEDCFLSLIGIGPL